ncbi:hypothetical protein E8E14_003074 [Neopestalotiopsis sp. 37M]|nr:hypothetical protein E8E14_003074 [Neopestalotiopsis sp. 37M]
MVYRGNHSRSTLIKLVICILGSTVLAADYGLIGWSIDGPAASSLHCYSGATFASSSGTAGCCGAPCSIPTACSGTTLFYSGTERYYTSGDTCFTPTIFESYPAETPSAKFFGCANGWDVTTLYRTSPVVAQTTSFTSSIPSSTTVQSTTSTSSPSASSSPGDSAPSSKAWIAGAVIGSIAILAVIGFSAFWFGWRKANRKKSLQSDQTVSQMGEQFMPPDSHRASQYTWKPEQASPVPQEATTYQNPATGTWSRPAEL